MPDCRTIVIAVPLLLALVSCGDEPDVTTENDEREASGEVLEGSISDAMLPLDQVRSQAPLAQEAVESAEPAQRPAEAESTVEQPANEQPAVEEPASEP